MADELAARPAGEVTLVVNDDGVLATGGSRDVEAWIDQLRGLVGDAAQASGVSTSRAADLAAVGTAAAALATLSNDYVRLTPYSMRLLRSNSLVPGTDGAFRMFVTGQGGQIVGQLQFSPITFGPALATAMQANAATAALRAAIATVEEAVERVEGKVDKLLALASAERAGDVVGHHQALAHVLKLVESTASLPTTDWDSVASLGPQLVAGTARGEQWNEIHRHLPHPPSFQKRRSRYPMTTCGSSVGGSGAPSVI